MGNSRLLAVVMEVQAGSTLQVLLSRDWDEDGRSSDFVVIVDGHGASGRVRLQLGL